MKKERLHIVSVIVGSILAAAIVFSQYLSPECLSFDHKTKTEQTGNETSDQKEVFVSLPSFSIPAPLSVQVNLDAYCLFEIFFEDDIDENDAEDDLSYTDHLFETLFRVIISPNAP